MRPQAIFFDLDDTIVDFTAPAGPAWTETGRRHAAAFGDVSVDTVLAAIQDTVSAFWSDPERHRRGRLDLQATRTATTPTRLSEPPEWRP